MAQDDVQLKRKKAQENFVQLKRKVTLAVKRVGLEGQQARVALALDISVSMRRMFEAGTVQRVCERLLALGVKFDDNGAVDIFLFGNNHYDVGELSEENFYGFVEREITGQYRLEGKTNYAGVINQIVEKYTTEPGDPAYVLFITDGDNHDKAEAEEVIVKASKFPIFWQFVGIGGRRSTFEFLDKLDTMSGRFIDNANFFALNDIDHISDDDLYRRMLVEFPSWLKEARQKGIY
jgi:hypothetical protein